MAIMPNAANCQVPVAKLLGYLLSHAHPDGAPKAKFLESFGFSRQHPNVLSAALLAHSVTFDVASERQTEYGQMFEIIGRIGSPDGRNPFVKVVWMIADDDDRPRLVTLVPSQEPTL